MNINQRKTLNLGTEHTQRRAKFQTDNLEAEGGVACLSGALLASLFTNVLFGAV